MSTEDRTDKNVNPACARCSRIGPASTFTTKVIYARKLGRRGPAVMTATRYTVCLDTDCGDQMQTTATNNS